MAFLDWSTTAGSNTSIGGIGIQGSNNVQNFDNAFRELMAQLKSGVDGKMTLLSKSAGYTAVANDNNAVIRFTAASTLALTAAATLGSGWHCIVQADGGAVTIDPNSTETINGATTLLVPDGGSTLVICDGTNFRALEDFQLSQSTVDIASATTTDLSTVGSFNVRITGTTTITGLGTAAEGMLKFVRMAGALTLTHNATSLILPNGGANITTAANDCFLARSLGSGNWLVMFYQRARTVDPAVVQSAQNIDGTAVSKGSTAGWLDTGVSVTLANNLRSTASQVRIRVAATLGANAAAGELFAIYRGTTSIVAAGINAHAGAYVPDTSSISNVAFEVCDTPGVTTPTTYRLYWNNAAGAATTRYLGRRGADTTFDLPTILTAEELIA